MQKQSRSLGTPTGVFLAWLRAYDSDGSAARHATEADDDDAHAAAEPAGLRAPSHRLRRLAPDKFRAKVRLGPRAVEILPLPPGRNALLTTVATRVPLSTGPIDTELGASTWCAS